MRALRATRLLRAQPSLMSVAIAHRFTTDICHPSHRTPRISPPPYPASAQCSDCRCVPWSSWCIPVHPPLNTHVPVPARAAYPRLRKQHGPSQVLHISRMVVREASSPILPTSSPLPSACFLTPAYSSLLRGELELRQEILLLLRALALDDEPGGGGSEREWGKRHEVGE